jgi:hypothetical protein
LRVRFEQCARENEEEQKGDAISIHLVELRSLSSA